MNRTTQSLLLGLWMTALFWPFPHAGGYLHPAILSLTPLLLSLADFLPHWELRVLYWLTVLYSELSVAWGTWASLHWLRLVSVGSVHKLLALPVQDWNQMSAHLAAPLLLMGGFLGWLLFRQCHTYGQALALWLLGAIVIPINHVLWHLPAELPLAAYLVIGLGVLTYFHHIHLIQDAHPFSTPWYRYSAWALVIILPLLIGWQMPSQAPHDPLNLFHGPLFASIAPLGADVTGYGPGVTQIGHPLVPNQSPVFIAHTHASYYWQAAIYTNFNGSSWSNSGMSSIYAAGPADSGIPLVSPDFLTTLPTHIVHATITDLSSTPFSTLFYTGVPTQFSVPITIHTRSDRFIGLDISHYQFTGIEPQYIQSALILQPFSEAPDSLHQDLELPHNLSPRVSRLAQQITANTSGPWLAAQAVKNYLDSHYRYSYNVTPTNGDVVNHFLFVDRQGYCDQFSTTFIMMMRSLKIPARWVVGYGPGTYDAARHGYLIRAVDAHSWAEIWISHIGWVPFDPTPGFNIPIHATNTAARTSSPQSIPTTSKSPTALPKNLKSPLLARLHPSGGGSLHAHRNHGTSNRQPQQENIVWDLLLVVSLVGLALIVIRHHQRTRETTAERLWHHMAALSRRRLGTRWHSKSPRQWGQEWLRYFPEDHDLIWPLVRLFEQAFYRRAPLNEAEQQRMKELWKKLKLRTHGHAS